MNRRLSETEALAYQERIGEIELSRSAIRQFRRLLDRGGQARTLTVTRTRSGGWQATVGFRGVLTQRLAPSSAIGAVDRGITVTAALPDGSLLVMPRFLTEARERIGAPSRERRLS